ncbi:aldehyde dehydrogenase family protein [Synechococcus moorigangaii CMS01]|nr:aldehyde dehydrogenase family protein [Synechococcus moorigangaii CMS01]
MIATVVREFPLKQQRQFFASGQTRSAAFRREQLMKFRAAVLAHQEEAIAALAADLRKPEFEARFEMIALLNEIDYALKHLKRWLKLRPARLTLMQLPGKAYQLPEPLGVVLIIGPWNFPFSLSLQPLVGAIAAGNCAIVKPSEGAPATAKIIAKLIRVTFPDDYIAAVEGDIDTSQALLTEKFDHIFFTGGAAVGKIVMAAAAKHLTPVTLELGGKSPCIVDSNIDLKEAAKRITWGKFLNAGQICIAPDYLLVAESLKDELLLELTRCIREFYGENPQVSPDYPRLISDRHWRRAVALLHEGEIYHGGRIDRDDRYIEPTILLNPNPRAPVMQEEIFAPILPVLTYKTLAEAIAFIQAKPKPLALYIFSRSQNVQQQILTQTSSGGVCINDTVMQVGVDTLPFGGVGESGMGTYHGKASFDTFTHYKAVLKKGFRFDLQWRYAPYAKNLPLLKRLFRSH